MTLARI